MRRAVRGGGTGRGEGVRGGRGGLESLVYCVPAALAVCAARAAAQQQGGAAGAANTSGGGFAGGAAPLAPAPPAPGGASGGNASGSAPQSFEKPDVLPFQTRAPNAGAAGGGSQGANGTGASANGGGSSNGSGATVGTEAGNNSSSDGGGSTSSAGGETEGGAQIAQVDDVPSETLPEGSFPLSVENPGVDCDGFVFAEQFVLSRVGDGVCDFNDTFADDDPLAFPFRELNPKLTPNLNCSKFAFDGGDCEGVCNEISPGQTGTGAGALSTCAYTCLFSPVIATCCLLGTARCDGKCDLRRACDAPTLAPTPEPTNQPTAAPTAFPTVPATSSPTGSPVVALEYTMIFDQLQQAEFQGAGFDQQGFRGRYQFWTSQAAGVLRVNVPFDALEVSFPPDGSATNVETLVYFGDESNNETVFQAQAFDRLVRTNAPAIFQTADFFAGFGTPVASDVAPRGFESTLPPPPPPAVTEAPVATPLSSPDVGVAPQPPPPPMLEEGGDRNDGGGASVGAIAGGVVGGVVFLGVVAALFAVVVRRERRRRRNSAGKLTRLPSTSANGTSPQNGGGGTGIPKGAIPTALYSNAGYREKDWSIPWAELELGNRILGKGAFGKVVAGRWKTKGTKVAIKFLTALEERCQELRALALDAQEQAQQQAANGSSLAGGAAPMGVGVAVAARVNKLDEEAVRSTGASGESHAASQGTTVGSGGPVDVAIRSVDDAHLSEVIVLTTPGGYTVGGASELGEGEARRDEVESSRGSRDSHEDRGDGASLVGPSDSAAAVTTSSARGEEATGERAGEEEERGDDEGAFEDLVSPEQVTQLEAECRQEIATFEAEMDMLFQVRHPNIVLLLGACIEEGHAAMVMELCQTNLETLLHKTNKPLDRRQRFNMAIGTASGMTYLHAQTPKILHRDLKPANLLLSRSGDVRICDFHLSRKIEQSVVVASAVGTPGYMAPEVLANQPYNEKADVWGFGLCLFELFTRQRPYGDYENQVALMNQVIQYGVHPRMPEPEDAFDADIETLYEDCMHLCPAERPSFGEISSRLLGIEERHAELLRRSSSATLSAAKSKTSSKSQSDPESGVRASASGGNDGEDAPSPPATPHEGGEGPPARKASPDDSPVDGSQSPAGGPMPQTSPKLAASAAANAVVHRRTSSGGGDVGCSPHARSSQVPNGAVDVPVGEPVIAVEASPATPDSDSGGPSSQTLLRPLRFWEKSGDGHGVVDEPQIHRVGTQRLGTFP